MFQSKKHLFFDLDHTLWDFEANSAACLREIFDLHFSQSNFSVDNFIETFSVENRKMWSLLDQGKIKYEEIRETRFSRTLGLLGVEINQTLSEELNLVFLQLLPKKGELIPGALPLLHRLKEKYHLHILSNGYFEVQCQKMKNSGIYHFFEHIITNDNADARKPQPEIFYFALKTAQAKVEESLMIGDSFEADILGAQSAGLEVIHFSPAVIDKNIPTIHRLEQILEYL